MPFLAGNTGWGMGNSENFHGVRFLLCAVLAGAIVSTVCSGGDSSRTGEGCLEGNCVNGTGRYSYSTGVYAGHFKDGVPNGEGVYSFANGDRYEGFNINFKKESYGTYLYHTGERYVGQWKNDRRDGYGIYYYASGDQYVGQWLDDVKKGAGTYHYKNGDRYEGAFSADKPHGKGTLYGRDGTVKTGYWVFGEYSGNR